MTESEAIEILRFAYPKESNRPITEEVISIAINALEEIQQYKELGTVEELMVAKEKQIDIATEIVKQGGISDDECEWESARDGEFIQNPHTKRLYSNEPSMQNVYCNTCGKKIKIVGD